MQFAAMSNRSSARRAAGASVFPEMIESHAPELLSGKSSATVLSMIGVMFAVAADATVPHSATSTPIATALKARQQVPPVCFLILALPLSPCRATVGATRVR
jgi:hypothetical protein